MGASWSAPIRSFFGKDKVKEEVQQGVEVVVNVAEQGLHQLDVATSGAVSSIADELSKAGVDLSQFKNSIVEKLENDVEKVKDDIHKLEGQVSTVGKKAEAGVSDIGQNLKNEFQNVETQTEVKVEKAEEAAKTVFVNVEKGAEAAVQKVTAVTDVLQKTEETAVETVSSLASELISFGGFTETNERKNGTATPPATVTEDKEKDLASGSVTGDAEKVPNEKDSSPTSDVVEEPIKAKPDVVEETPSPSVTPSLSDGWSSDQHFLRDTIAKSKEIVIDSLSFGDRQSKTKTEKPAPEFQSTQNSLSSSTETKDQPEIENNSDDKSTSDTKGTEMSDERREKQSSPVKEVDDFLNQEKSESSKHIEIKSEEIKVPEAKSVGENKAEPPKHHSFFDNITNIGSSITNTIHNIETGIENTGKDILTGVGTKVKEAGEFIAGTEEEQDPRMDDNQLKIEAVTSVLDKSFIN